MRSEKLFRPFIRPMFNSHCGGIRLDEVSLMKRIGALLLCGILLLPAAGASGTPWPAWAAEALAWGREKSVSRAFLASPGQRLTRGAVARLLYESAGQPAAHEECPFSDVSEKDAVAVGWAAGICRYPLETGGNTRGTGPRTRAFWGRRHCVGMGEGCCALVPAGRGNGRPERG